MRNYQELLETGKAVLRRTWTNTNSEKDQVSMQFAQKIKVPTQGTASALVAMAQENEGLGYNIVTTIFSAKRSFIEGKGLESDVNYFEEDAAPLAEDIFGTAVSVKVIENFEKNPFSRSQTPKQNPTNGKVLCVNGKPIYRHTELVEGDSPEHIFVKHDNSEVGAIATAAVSVEQNL